MVKATSAAPRPIVSADGTGVVDHCGAAALAELADTLGLTAALSQRPSRRRRRRSAHDPGVVLRDLVVSIADGATGLADLAVLRNQPDLFGDVAPHATAWRTIERIADDELGGIDGIEAAPAAAHERHRRPERRQISQPNPGPVLHHRPGPTQLATHQCLGRLHRHPQPPVASPGNLQHRHLVESYQQLRPARVRSTSVALTPSKPR